MSAISFQTIPQSSNDFFKTVTQAGKDVVIPIGNLFEPTFRAIEVGTNACRGWKSLHEAVALYKNCHYQEATEALIKTAYSVAQTVGFIFWFQAANITSLSVDLVIQAQNVVKHAKTEDYEKAYQALISGYVDLMLLTVEVLGGPEVRLISLMTSTLADLWEVSTTIDAKQPTRTTAYIARPIIRCVMSRALPGQLAARFFKRS